MAKQITVCLTGRRKGDVWVAWLTLALIVVLCPGDVPGAAAGAPSDSPSSTPALSSNAIVVPLEYQETGYDVFNWSASVRTQTTPFKKEPAAVAGKIVRGVISFGGDSSQSIPFLWQSDAGKLYLDLNRNQDLTDDPAGVFSSARGPGQSYVQNFTNVPVTFTIASARCKMLANITLYNDAQPICLVAARSFWQGKLTLQGRDWQVGIVQTALDKSGSFENSQLLLRPWEQRAQPFSAMQDGSLAAVPFSRNIFMDGRAFQVDCVVRPQDSEARPALQFVEHPVALGEVKITGQFISRLVLMGGLYQVVLDQPAGVVKIPTGTYNQAEVRLEHNGTAAFRKTAGAQFDARISVDERTPAVLNAGGPLTNSVNASRDGRDLVLDYLLIGAGGQTYQLAAQDPTKPPSFAIYKGEKKIESGDFEFG
ncbi:MAG: hypothetical protein ABSA47_01355 [Verrucomicrobiota bacterium]|jgi:hypothetical protein